jgi:hypothetical protein
MNTYKSVARVAAIMLALILSSYHLAAWVYWTPPACPNTLTGPTNGPGPGGGPPIDDTDRCTQPGCGNQSGGASCTRILESPNVQLRTCGGSSSSKWGSPPGCTTSMITNVYMRVSFCNCIQHLNSCQCQGTSCVDMGYTTAPEWPQAYTCGTI